MKRIAAVGLPAVLAAVLAAGCASKTEVVPEAETPQIRAALFVDKGAAGCGAFFWARLLEYSPQVRLTLIDGQDVRDGKLKDFDLAVFPGGGGMRQMRALGPEGMRQVLDFVENGGAYLGICAGSYNAMDRKGRLRLLPYDYIQNANGVLADLSVDFGEEGARRLGIRPGQYVVRYHGGNVMRPSSPTGKGEAEVLAVYRNSVSGLDRAPHDFRDTPAAVFGQYGKGKALAISFHPESYEGTRCIASGAVYALTGVRPVPVYPETQLRPLRVGFYAEFTRDCVRQLFELERRPELDVMQVDGHDMLTGILRHLDVFVIAGDRKSLLKKAMDDPVRAGQFRDFLARGGRLVKSAYSSKVLPANDNVTVVAEKGDLVRAVPGD